MRLLGNRVDADDAAQESVARAVERWEQIAPYARNWAVRTVTNIAIDVLRERGRLDLGLLPDLARPTHGIDEGLDIERALLQLPIRQRQVIFLRMAGGLTVREVALQIGCSEGAVKRHLFRARAALRVSLSDWDTNEADPKRRIQMKKYDFRTDFVPAKQPDAGWPERPWDHWFIETPDGGRDRVAVGLDGVPILDGDGDEVMSGPGFDHEVVKVMPGRSLDPPDPAPDLSSFQPEVRSLLAAALDEAAFYGHPWIGDEHLALALTRHLDLSIYVGHEVPLDLLDGAIARFYEGPWADKRLDVVRARRDGASFLRQRIEAFSWNHAMQTTLASAEELAGDAVEAKTIAQALFAKDHCLPRILLERQAAAQKES